ncbi:hypothetical protein F5Y00DRAFT_228443 [Daldinia vernicosa]|uniref:uncharacterized protein n=1 Tax=Daldinia vernicosa TaxID=114800 RepID=UPI0020087980|nr:uncharacterized protein F5Y00DRAFT_228443 [Daldinia vernicosa]KAI0852023.1 hypothetical protein F5Y00DRAFT_228443 [Daldinia vernicosa]
MLSKGSRVTASTNVKTERNRLHRRTKCCKVLSPGIGSLYDILHDHASTALYVPPLCWTEFHTQVLGCRFMQQPPQTTPVPSSPSSPSRKSQHPKVPQTVVHISRTLDIIMKKGIPTYEQNEAMKSVLNDLFPGQLSPTDLSSLTLRCGKDRYISGVRCQALYKDLISSHSFESTTTCSSDVSIINIEGDTRAPYNPPILAYLDLDYLNHIRRNCFRVSSGPNGSFNGPIHRLQKIRSEKLIPKNPNEDQYILATILAMAQQHVYGNMFTGEGFVPKDVEVRVLTVSKNDESFVVYSSVVPTAFLTMFHEPGKSPQGNTKFTINYQHVPIWPVLGLKERLGQALGKDLIGEFDIDRIETFQDEPVPSLEGGKSDSFDEKLQVVLQKLNEEDESISNTAQRTPSPKRKRRIFSEVFNGSFSENYESSGYPSELLAKRRRLAEGRVGVVR